MRSAAAGLLLAATLACATSAWAAGSTTLWYRGSFDGEVVVRDGAAPGYYYHPSPSRYPTFSQYYDHPVVCAECGRWRKVGEKCAWCGTEPSREERQQTRRETVYSPYPLSGQYWYKKQPHFRFRAPIRCGWPYIKYDRPWD
jgi:hypothetical protein